MRNAGDGTPGGASGRRQRVTAPPETARPTGNGGASLFTPAYRVSHAAVPSQAGSSRLGSAGYGATSDPADGARWSDQASSGYGYSSPDPAPGGTATWADSDVSEPGYSWLTDDNGAWPTGNLAGRDYSRNLRNAIRGFAPVPDEPLPSYPPGPFAAWNRGSSERGEHPRRGDMGRGTLTTATITPDEFDTNHSMPAIKDPIPGTATTTVRTPRTDPQPGTRAQGTRAQGTRARGGQRAAVAAPPSRSAPGRGPAKSGRAARGSRKRRQPAWMAIGAAVIIVAGVTAILVTTSLGSGKPSAAPKPPSHHPQPTQAATPTPPPGIWEYIGTRTTDKAPLTIPEVFPASFVAKHVYFHATALKLTHNCHAAVIGTALQAAVRVAGCSQALRASYVARKDDAMATIGVFNLTTAAAANKAAHHAGHSQFVAQLTTKNGVTSKIGQGTGIEEALVKGHFLILVWAEKTDLTPPKTTWQRGHLTGFMNTLIAKTVNGSLSYRMVEGKPIPPSQNHH